MSEWKEYLLEDLADEITVGFVGSMADEYVEKGITFLRSKNVDPHRINLDDIRYITPGFHQKIKKSALTPGDVVIVRTGKPGAASIIPDSLAESNCSDLVIVRPSSNLDRHFLVYYLNSIAVHYINSYLVGAVQQHFNIGAARKLKITLPKIEEQKRVADVLSCLDAKIDNLRRQNETLEEIARSIFKHWFIDFEFPNADGKPYKSSGGAMVRSDLGDIPEGWQVGTLGDVATNNSETHKFEDKNKIIFINTGDVLDGKFLHENYMSVNTLPGQAKKRIAKDDILYSEIRPKNKHFAYINFERNIENYVVSTKFMVLRANDFILPRLLYLILKRQESIDEFNYIAESRSGTFPQITFEAVSHSQFPLPPIDIQKYLMPIFTNLMEKKEFNVVEIQTLTKTRDALLPKLMSGQLRVNE